MVIYLGIDPSLAFSAVAHSAVVFEVALREETSASARLQAASKDMIPAGKRHIWRVSPSLVGRNA